MNKFPSSIFDKLGYYVYVYIDPREGFKNEVFYVGKGEKNRAFSHLSDTQDNKKVKRIKEIKEAKLEPKIEILIHGLESDKQALKIESSIIDLIGIKNLTNRQQGYESATYGRMSIEQIISRYAAEKVEICPEHRVILIKINETFRYGMPAIELYDATRSAWTVNENRIKNIQFAFAVYEGIVQEVYEIKAWFPNKSTYNTREDKVNDTNDDRWEFVGKIAVNEIKDRYIYKDVSEFVKDTQNPIRYINC